MQGDQCRGEQDQQTTCLPVCVEGEFMANAMKMVMDNSENEMKTFAMGCHRHDNDLERTNTSCVKPLDGQSEYECTAVYSHIRVMEISTF